MVVCCIANRYELGGGCFDFILPSLRLFSFGSGEKFVDFVANGCLNCDSVLKKCIDPRANG